MVVGDDAQSIYAWRGANFQNIFKFPKRYPDAKVFKIETNYRSTPEILKVANAAIAANTQQFTKELAPARKSGLKPALVACSDAAQQAAFIAQSVGELPEEGVDLNQVAVLYRSHFHALELQLELTQRQHPVFHHQRHPVFRAGAHQGRHGVSQARRQSARRELPSSGSCNCCRESAAKGAEKIWKIFSAKMEDGRSRWQISSRPADPNSPSAIRRLRVAHQLRRPPSLRQIRSGEGGDRLGAIRRDHFATRRRNRPQERGEDAAAGAGRGLRRLSQGKLRQLPQPAGRPPATRRVCVSIRSASRNFSRNWRCSPTSRPRTAIRRTDDAEKIRLSTIHQAKGLEFDVVFVIMLCDGLFPSARSMESPEGEEEERRLFYVAITRAKNELYLSYPLMRAGFGSSGGDAMQQPSRFLSEIPRDLLNEWNLRSRYA